MITVEKEDFLNAIRATKNCVAKLSIQQVLSCIHVKSTNSGLILTATDLTISGRAYCDARIDNNENIDICLNAVRLENIVSKLEDFITLEIEDGFLKIKSGETLFKMLIIPSEDFPQIEFELKDEGTKKIEINADDFVSGVNKALISTANTENTVLNSVCLTLSPSGYELASTDGNRLCQIKHEGDTGVEGQYVIPQKILQNLVKNAQDVVEINTYSNSIVFKTARCVFKQNLFAGMFPKYQQLIPQNLAKRAIIEKRAFLQSLEKVAIMCDDRTNICVFCFRPNELTIKTSCSEGNATDSIKIECNGSLDIAFNYRYILDGVRGMESDNVTVEMGTEVSPCLFKGDFLYLVMPVKPR